MHYLLSCLLQLFHQLLTASLSRATEPYPDIHSWAKVYNVNIGLKYKEIEVLLYNQGGCFNASKYISVSFPLYSFNTLGLSLQQM